MLVVEVCNLVKHFGNVQALRGLNLELDRGVTGLVGPNGAGKTTTIGILLGLLKPNRGEARVFGSDCWRNSFKVRQKVGVLYEKPAYPGGFTGRRYLEYVAKFYGVGNPRKRAAELLGIVGFSEAADRNIGTYSAGMVQRIGLAQALIGEPELVILDEPTANLDPIGRVEFLEKIRELHQEKDISFIISTHVLGELETVCDQVAIISEGVVKDQGKVQDLAKRHQAEDYVIVVSDSQLLAAEIRKAGFARQVNIVGGKVIVKTECGQRLQNEVMRTVNEHRLKLIAWGPQYGILESIYRKVLEGR